MTNLKGVITQNLQRIFNSEWYWHSNVLLYTSGITWQNYIEKWQNEKLLADFPHSPSLMYPFSANMTHIIHLIYIFCKKGLQWNFIWYSLAYRINWKSCSYISGCPSNRNISTTKTLQGERCHSRLQHTKSFAIVSLLSHAFLLVTLHQRNHVKGIRGLRGEQARMLKVVRVREQ